MLRLFKLKRQKHMTSFQIILLSFFVLIMLGTLLL